MSATSRRFLAPLRISPERVVVVFAVVGGDGSGEEDKRLQDTMARISWVTLLELLMLLLLLLVPGRPIEERLWR